MSYEGLQFTVFVLSIVCFMSNAIMFFLGERIHIMNQRDYQARMNEYSRKLWAVRDENAALRIRIREVEDENFYLKNLN